MNNTVNRSPIDHATVATAAYNMWEQDGRPDGQDMEYWLKAEQLLRAKRQLAEIRSSYDTSAGKNASGRQSQRDPAKTHVGA